MKRIKKKYDESWMRWKCNYKENCNNPSYYHTTNNGKHIYICPKHLEEHLGFVEVKVS